TEGDAVARSHSDDDDVVRRCRAWRKQSRTVLADDDAANATRKNRLADDGILLEPIDAKSLAAEVVARIDRISGADNESVLDREDLRGRGRVGPHRADYHNQKDHARERRLHRRTSWRTASCAAPPSMSTISATIARPVADYECS